MSGLVDEERLERVRGLCRRAVESGEIPGLALAVACGEQVVLDEAWGRTGPDPESLPATPETVWLIASVTKPVVCAAVCLLLERGELLLDDPVRHFLPEFHGEDRAGMTLRHLLTHTSGLPDMLPENVELRRRHAALGEFVRRICATPLLFPPGTDVSYQSTGIALLGEVVARVSGQPCREFLRREIFEPLDMPSCSLGWREDLAGRVAACVLPEGQEPSDWDWNSPYWREFGAPWGGMFATAREYLRFLRMLQAEGKHGDRRILAPATVRAMTTEQTEQTEGLPAPAARRERSSWGLGWQIGSPHDPGWLPDLGEYDVYGHGGSTGTGAWNCAYPDVSFVFFSGQPAAKRWIRRLGNCLLAAATD